MLFVRDTRGTEIYLVFARWRPRIKIGDFSPRPFLPDYIAKNSSSRATQVNCHRRKPS